MNFWRELLDSVFPKRREKRFAAMLHGDNPVFSQFGRDVYVSDFVKNAIRAIAAESSKVTVKSVIEYSEPRRIEIQNDEITALFRYRPNPLMTTQQFFYRIAWLRKINLNAYVYPKYHYEKGRKVFDAFYPLNPESVGFSYVGEELYITFRFKNSQEYTLPYSEVIHLRDEYGENEFLGGDENGLPDNREQLKTVSVLDTVMQGLPKAIRASLQLRGVYSTKSMIGAEALAKERANFEKQLNDSEAGIVPIGLDGEFTPMTINPALVPKDTIEWLENKVLKRYGVSMSIISGDFTEEEYSAFYQRCIEDFIVQCHQAFTACCFTRQEQAEGKQVKLYDRYVQHLSMQTKFKMLQFAAPMGAFGKDEVRELMGYEPLGDNTVMQSLNWVDANLAPQYQIGKVKQPTSGQQELSAAQGEEIVDSTEQVVGEKLNGAQIASLISVVQSVSAGTLSYDSGIAILVSTLGVSQAAAEKILGKMPKKEGIEQ